MDRTELIGNLTTIIKALGMIIAGWTIGIFASQGLDLGISQTDLATAITTILGLVLAYFDAKYPNTIVDKATPEIKVEVTTDELSDAIKTASQEVETEEIDVVDEDDQQ